MTRRRPAALVAAALALCALGGCSSATEGTAAPSPVSAPSADSTVTTSAGGPAGETRELAAGLLPADAFGSGATVAPVSADDVGAATGLGGALAGATITPADCAAALRSAQGPDTDVAGLVGQSVTDGSTITVEVLTVGGTGDPLADLVAAAARCPEITASFPQTTGTMTVALAPLPLPDLGDGAAGLVDTTTVHGANGVQLVIPVMLAVVADGDRVLTVLGTIASEGGTVDRAAFTALVQQAFEYQADQLD